MRKIVLMCTLLTGLMFGNLFAQKGGDEKDIRSDLPSTGTNPFTYSKYPQPFNQYNQNKDLPAISTGYYFNDNVRNGNLESQNDYYLPRFRSFQSVENFEPERWTKIYSGPRITDSTIFTSPTNEKGLYFFRNPAFPTQNGGYYFEHSSQFGTDSTDDAFAGPMPIGLVRSFLFNGIEYDSFYVSTNGVIALTNTRYIYDENGARIVPPGKSTAYNENSADWFYSNAGRRTRLPGAASLTDNTQDDFGYRFTALGNLTGLGDGNARGGIRNYPTSGAGINSVISPDFRSAIIAPFWADLQLSQWDADSDILNPRGEVWWKTDKTRSYLTIYMRKYQFRSKFGNSVWTPGGSVQIGQNQRLVGGRLAPEGSAQVFLDTRDTSITMVYGEFAGSLTLGGRTYNADDIFRWNTMAGVSGFARHVNYDRPGTNPETGLPFPNSPSQDQPWTSEYQQYTYYWNFERQPATGPNYPRDLRSVQFRQLQNTVRVEAIEYRVRSLDPNASLDFTQVIPPENVNNYELYSDVPRLGAIQPVAVIQNLSNNIQGPSRGINYVRQDLDFQARFRVINKATEKTRYNSLVPINERCLEWDDSQGPCDGRSFEDIDFVSVRVEGGKLVIEDKDYNTPANTHYHRREYTGLPPYEFVRVFFPPWIPAPDLDSDVGRFAASITAEPIRNNGERLNDEWPFDDIQSNNLFVLRNLDEFYDDANEFHVVDNSPMPSVLKWVNLGAEVVEGDAVSVHPLPPRTDAEAANSLIYPNYILRSPAINLNRFTTVGTDWTAVMNKPYGDIIASFPIDIRTKEGAFLSISVQRTSKRDSWDRGYSDQELVGPEPRAVFNSNLLNHWKPAAAASANPDSLVVEFARPSRNEIENIVNIPDSEWRYLPRRGKLSTDADAIERKTPALTVFGGGGYITPFYELDRDSILPQTTDTEFGGLKANFYDTGIDFGFNKYFIPIPDTFVYAPNRGGRTFRFRIRVVATNDQKCITCIPDDNDNFYVDNVTLLEGSEESTDMEISKVFARWPYTEAPATQATEVPIKVQISNNTSKNAPFYFSQVIIWRGGINQIPRDNLQIKNLSDQYEPVYCRSISVPQHIGGTDRTWDLPAFNAKEAGEGLYTLMGIVHVEGGDRDIRNDTTFTEFEINFGDSFGYDPDNAGNEVPGVPGAKPGQGLGTFGYQTGGTGLAGGGGYSANFNPNPHSIGYEGGNGSGTIAMQFELITADTLYGYKAYFAEVNQAPDPIQYRLYEDNGGTPGQQIAEGRLTSERGYDFERTPGSNDYYFQEYVSVRLDEPVVLQKGKYWVGVVQLGETSMELAANGTRAAQRTLNYSCDPTGGPQGIAGVQSNIHPEFREENDRGNLINKNFFALENTAGSGTWLPFSPPVGNNAYAHLDHSGSIRVLNPQDATMTLSRGYWIPLIRPYLGEKASGEEPVVENCPEWIPVELLSFNSRATNRGIELMWETASEIDNYGFYVERRDVTEGIEDDWNQVAFVKGNGTTTTLSTYNHMDKDVFAGHTYSYRLRQVDRDGSQSCNETLVQTETFMGENAFVLETASPNPFGQTAQMTTIDYTVPAAGNVTLEIVDVFGNTVRTLVSDNMSAGRYSATWDATDAQGREVSTGSYIYRLTVNGETLTNKVQYRK